MEIALRFFRGICAFLAFYPSVLSCPNHDAQQGTGRPAAESRSSLPSLRALPGRPPARPPLLPPGAGASAAADLSPAPSGKQVDDHEERQIEEDEEPQVQPVGLPRERQRLAAIRRAPLLVPLVPLIPPCRRHRRLHLLRGRGTAAPTAQAPAALPGGKPMRAQRTYCRHALRRQAPPSPPHVAPRPAGGCGWWPLGRERRCGGLRRHPVMAPVFCRLLLPRCSAGRLPPQWPLSRSLLRR